MFMSVPGHVSCACLSLDMSHASVCPRTCLLCPKQQSLQLHPDDIPLPFCFGNEAWRCQSWGGGVISWDGGVISWGGGVILWDHLLFPVHNTMWKRVCPHEYTFVYVYVLMKVAFVSLWRLAWVSLLSHTGRRRAAWSRTRQPPQSVICVCMYVCMYVYTYVFRPN